MPNPSPELAANDTDDKKQFETLDPIAKKSNELVLGLVGYAGAGCSTISKSMQLALKGFGYDVTIIKFSSIIREILGSPKASKLEGGALEEGKNKLKEAVSFQDKGDKIRRNNDFALSAHAIKKIKKARGKSEIGKTKKAFILDSLKHKSEVLLLREVYGSSFKLLAIHCDSDRRFERLFGTADSRKKFAGASKTDVKAFMDRDEKDSQNKWGQQVREVFHLADYFVDDNNDEETTFAQNTELKRFFEILQGNGFHRPEEKETAMYTAVSASLRSSCLSRQVGAAIFDKNGNLISIGSNDVPKFGGGTYLEANDPDNRCAYWKFEDSTEGFTGCHNTRHKVNIKAKITTYIKKEISCQLPNFIASKYQVDLEKAEDDVSEFLENRLAGFNFPNLNDLIEFSRSIHAEMDALFSALRQGKTTVGATLYCTTFPCHNCARHLVTAGIVRLYYIEPYVKSLAVKLHSDSIITYESENNEKQSRLEILPFTGIGPRMYEEHFLKIGELKDDTGNFLPLKIGSPIAGTRLDALQSIEDKAIALISRSR